MGAMTPYDSGPCSMTRGSDTLGSNMTALGVTSNTPQTTPCKKFHTKISLHILQHHSKVLTIFPVFNKQTHSNFTSEMESSTMSVHLETGHYHY
jgi:hypothetical protein